MKRTEWYGVHTLLVACAMQQAGDINNAGGMDIPGETWAEGDLPAQAGGGYETLMPGVRSFMLPGNLAQLWDTVEVLDSRKGSKTEGQKVKRLRLKLDKNNPLVVVDGPEKGETMTWTVTSNPRPRGKADDPSTVWVSDLAYLLEIGLGDKSRPTTAEGLKQQISKYAGRTIRLETGLSAHCRADKVRYILQSVQTANGVEERSVQDPTGQKGCGDDSQQRADGKGKKGRYYTKDFKDPESGEYLDTIECDCGAVLRGFANVERILPPLGS